MKPECSTAKALDFIYKANSIGILVTVRESPDRNGYLIFMAYDWLGIGSITEEVTYIPKYGGKDDQHARSQGETLDFDVAMSLFTARISMREQDPFNKTASTLFE